ncbi:type IV toxin-antitoxin system AbiEi family antitoxin domain-containing protein [Hyphomonas sp. UBA1923]|uniref:type IV toxin-antitoxin system AbiEi family antitoxin domain-containing protein n=1 Tax=Hyphomonas sp. UBA1923 TaxID=1946617 RepID=UPI0025B9E157|nr:type IV toxin-antitoxin system AbiEi family antitoxin domain-containing protein [Hyphomonas sp. UBA1923]|tara:strand:+ start:22356 stop:23204 length:849 start_codon:yes stop_codon:yes gene_type:complete
MNERNFSKLKRLEHEVPEGLLVSARWLTEHGYERSLRAQYLKSGWLEQPARGVFRRPRGSLRWEQVIISLQDIMQIPLIVGGRTALELQGYAHFLSHEPKEVHLYGEEKLPGWMNKLSIPQKFVLHKGTHLFKNQPITRALTSLNWNTQTDDVRSNDPIHGNSFKVMPWGQWDWPMTVSAPERAYFELLDELPNNESFHMVDKLAEGLLNLSPNRLNKLLADCKSVKVKRLFFYFADRHKPRWRNRVDPKDFDLGTGDRMLVRGGKFDPVYRITVPGDLDAL